MMEHGLELARFARARIAQELGGPVAQPPPGAWTGEHRATFVTLRWRDGHLQGCIGSLSTELPIVVDVERNAVAAAIRDPRGEHLVLAKIKDLDLELSILSPLERVASWDDIRPRSDGVVLVYRGRRGTFLPVMWETFPDKPEFLRQLERKAELPTSYDQRQLEIWRYTAAKFEDPAP